MVMLGGGAYGDTGLEMNSVELYSPDGQCQHFLSPFPQANDGFALTYFHSKILATGGVGPMKREVLKFKVKECTSHIMNFNDISLI